MFYFWKFGKTFFKNTQWLPLSHMVAKYPSDGGRHCSSYQWWQSKGLCLCSATSARICITNKSISEDVVFVYWRWRFGHRRCGSYGDRWQFSHRSHHFDKSILEVWLSDLRHQWLQCWAIVFGGLLENILLIILNTWKYFTSKKIEH